MFLFIAPAIFAFILVGLLYYLQRRFSLKADETIKLGGIFSGILFAFVTTVGGYYISQNLEQHKNSLQKQQFQYENITKLADLFASFYNRNYPFLNHIVDKYGIKDDDEIYQKATQQEKIVLDKITAEYNYILSQLYVIAPEKIYEEFTNVWRAGKFQYREMGEKILIAFKKGKLPKHSIFEKRRY